MKPDVPLFIGLFNFASFVILFFSTWVVFLAKLKSEKRLLRLAMKWFLASLLMTMVGFGGCSMFYEWRLG